MLETFSELLSLCYAACIPNFDPPPSPPIVVFDHFFYLTYFNLRKVLSPSTGLEIFYSVNLDREPSIKYVRVKNGGFDGF